MSRHDDLYERLRAADPAADIDADRAADPEGPQAHRVRTRVLQAGRAARPLAGRTPRKRVVVLAAAGLMFASSVTAVTAGVFEPDPVEVADTLKDAEETGAATILEDAKQRGVYEVKTEDWRPALRSERVICAHEDGSIGSTSVAHPEDFPIEEGIDEDDLIAACVGGTDQTRHLDVHEEFTLCEGVIPADDVRATVEAMTGGQGPLEGQISDDRPAFPVVLGWDADCDTAGIATSPERTELAAWTPGSTEALNRAREVEIGLTAAALDRCLHPDEARLMASQARAELAGDWAVVAVDWPTDQTGEAACSRVRLDAQGRGLLDIGPRR